MSSFSLKVDPQLPRPSQIFKDLDFSDLDRAKLIKLGDKIDLTYVISGREFGYYPSNAFVALDDLYSELDKIRSGEDHYTTLSGYQILFVSRNHDKVIFHDLNQASGNEPHGTAIGTVQAVEVEDQLVEAASALIEFTGALQQAS